MSLARSMIRQWNDRGVGQRQAYRMPEQRDDGEPVGEATDQRCLGEELYSGELGICALQASADDKQYPHQRKQGDREQFNASQAVPLLQLIHRPTR
jgi:hypothetical protein